MIPFLLLPVGWKGTSIWNPLDHGTLRQPRPIHCRRAPFAISDPSWRMALRAGKGEHISSTQDGGAPSVPSHLDSNPSGRYFILVTE